jgi:DNA invertase Pin-like site-specific DNA recombinase
MDDSAADRRRTLLRRTGGTGRRPDRDRWTGEPAAVYCRISHVADDDQTGVDRQERICRDVAERLGLAVAPDRVYVDNNRSAWHRTRRRAGWDALLAAARSGAVRHIVAYHPDRLMRQPRDLEELLAISDEGSITLHGQANRRDLSDPDDRFFLRIEVAHACRSSDDTSRRLKDAMVDRASEGLPHAGMRRYGYSKDGMTPDPAEADVVLEIFHRYLDGQTPGRIARDLNRRNVPTARGKKWYPATVLSVLDCAHLAGILVFRGQEVGRGAWPAIVDEGTWAEVRDRRALRAAAWRATARQEHFYLLRGLVTCRRCGARMTGDGGNSYLCSRRNRPDDTVCGRRVRAAKLEEFVAAAAVDLLTRLDVTGKEADALALTEAARAAVAADEAELAEIKAMWEAREIPASEYRAMRKTVADRVRKTRSGAVRRPAVEVLDGLAGPDAPARWAELAGAGEVERLNAVLRFLFAAVVIDESAPGVFDYARIGVEQNPL